MSWLTKFVQALDEFFINIFHDPIDTNISELPMNQEPPPTFIPLRAVTTYLWDTPDQARHSVRLICDEEGLTVEQKDTLCATVGDESGWKPSAIGPPNADGSRDYGICQINTRYWIGPGRLFPTTDYVLAHPEQCVRWMCKQWKMGYRNWWIAYKSGRYKSFL